MELTKKSRTTSLDFQTSQYLFSKIISENKKYGKTLLKIKQVYEEAIGIKNSKPLQIKKCNSSSSLKDKPEKALHIRKKIRSLGNMQQYIDNNTSVISQNSSSTLIKNQPSKLNFSYKFGHKKVNLIAMTENPFATNDTSHQSHPSLSTMKKLNHSLIPSLIKKP